MASLVVCCILNVCINGKVFGFEFHYFLAKIVCFGFIGSTCLLLLFFPGKTFRIISIQKRIELMSLLNYIFLCIPFGRLQIKGLEELSCQC